MKWLMTLSNKSKLPYDAEIEWLANKSSDSALPSEYIDTGWFCDYDKGFRIEVVCCIKTLQRRYTLVSNYDCENNMALELFSFPCTIRGYCQNYNFFNTSGDSLTKDQFFTAKLEYYDGIVKTYNDDYVNQNNKILSGYSSKTALMFVDQKKRFGTFADQLKIAACKIYDGHELFRDFIPVRKGNVGYMYDRVSGKLFGNSGTGSFVLGPDVKTFGCMTTKNKRQSEVWNMIARAKRAVNYTAKDYVQDGLIAMWDGIENAGYGQHTDDLSRGWIDLVSGATLNLQDGKYVWHDTYLQLNLQNIGGTSTTFPTESTFYREYSKCFDNRTLTYESVQALDEIRPNAGEGEPNNPRNGINPVTYYFLSLYPNLNSVLCDYFTSGYGWCWSPQYRLASDESLLDIRNITLAVTPAAGYVNKISGKMFIDGELKSSVGVIPPDANVSDENLPNYINLRLRKWTVGSKYNGASVDRQFCFRIYNRALTPDEIRHNYMIDKRRFGI